MVKKSESKVKKNTNEGKKPDINKIRYAQCWEDPSLNSEALKINEGDHVVSIAAGGDNCFALLLDDPEFIAGVDINPVQIAFCEIKKLAIKQMDYDDFLAFTGVAYSSKRIELYRLVRSQLSTFCREYFDNNLQYIEQGIIHCGKFENYFHHFRTKVLKITHAADTIEMLLFSKSLKEQKEIYHELWNNKKWQLLVKVFCSEFVLGRVSRDPALFKYVKQKSVSEAIMQRIERSLTKILISKNYYMHYILTGKYIYKDCMPPYLLKKNFNKLKENLYKIDFYHTTVDKYIIEREKGVVSKIDFSNIFDYMTDDAMTSVFDVLVEYAKDDLKLVYRTLLEPKECPAKHKDNFENDKELGTKLNNSDKGFFNNDFEILIKK